MRWRRGALMSLGVLACVVAGGGAAAVSPASAASALGSPGEGLIRAPGGPFMTDQYGRRVLFHGVNLVAKCPADSQPSSQAGTPCVPQAPGQPPAETNYWLSPTAADPDRRFTDADAAGLARLGFNLARVGLVWRGLEPGLPAQQHADDAVLCKQHAAGTPFAALGANDPYDAGAVDAYLAHIDSEVQLLAAHGIYSLVDMHQDAFNEHFNNPGGSTPWEGEGAPLWATCTGERGTGVPQPNTAASDSTWNSGYTHNTAMAQAYDHFWSNDVDADLQGQFLRVWSRVVQHFATNPWVIGWDPYNEPYDSFYTPTAAFDARLQCFYMGTRTDSRACAIGNVANPVESGFIPTAAAAEDSVPGGLRHLVFYEEPLTTDFGQPPFVGSPLLGPLHASNVVLNFHDYGLVGAFFGGISGQPGECSTPDCAIAEDTTMTQFDHGRALTTTDQGANGGGPAMFMSEFGAEDNAADIAHVAGLADSTPVHHYPVSWTYWAAFQLHDPTGDPHQRLFDAARHEVQPKGCVLTRAYARAAAGTPTLQAFDPATSAYELRFTPDPSSEAGGHHTEVILPADRYRAGYAAVISGGRQDAASGPDLLVVASDPGATSVEVRLTAADPGACSFQSTAAANGAPPSSPVAVARSAAGTLPNTTAGAGRLPALLLPAVMALAVAALVVRRRRTNA